MDNSGNSSGSKRSEGINEDQELEMIRLKRMQKVMAMKQQQELYKKQQENLPSLDDKIEMVIKIILTPDAYAYLNSLRTKDIDLYNNVKKAILPPQLIAEINNLIYYMQQGMLRSGVISQMEIKYIE